MTRLERVAVDLVRGLVTVEEGGTSESYPLGSPQAFAAISRAWIRCGWDVKYTYTFTWLGRPVIQLPEDLLRLQEAVYVLRPDVIVETGVAHGGSVIFLATLCRAIGHGRVIGVDREIRPANRRAIETHELRDLITLVEGDSADPAVVARVKALAAGSERVLVVLDSSHTRRQVLAELEAYAELVSVDSYVIVQDGVMQDLADSPHASPEWRWDNPAAAAQEFLLHHPEFALEAPPWPFNESRGLREGVTYWPGGWLKRRSSTPA